jgi:hypothetical protein
MFTKYGHENKIKILKNRQKLNREEFCYLGYDAG